MNNNLEIYGAFRHKITVHRFFLITYDPVEQVTGLDRTKSLQTFGVKNINGCFSNGNFFIGPARLRK